jgi:hypothetical protein
MGARFLSSEHFFCERNVRAAKEMGERSRTVIAGFSVLIGGISREDRIGLTMDDVPVERQRKHRTPVVPKVPARFEMEDPK